MTDSGQKPPLLQNDLGGHEYTDDEKDLIHAIYTVLKNRDPDVNDMSKVIAGKAPHPKDYVFLYTKSAGFVYELAKNLKAYGTPKKMKEKSVCDWLEIVTGHDFEGKSYKRSPAATVSDDEYKALVSGFDDTDFPADSVSQAVRDGIVDGKTGALNHIRVSLSLDGKEVAHRGPGPGVENMDPEKAKAILIRICAQFPGLFNDGAEDCPGVAQELSILLRSSTEKLNENTCSNLVNT